MYRLSIGYQNTFDLADRLPFRLRCLKGSLHSVDSPEKIHGCRTRLAENVTDIIKLLFEIIDIRSDELLRTQCDSIRRGYADCRSPSHDHVLYARCDFIVRLQHQPLLFSRKETLIKHRYTVIGPFNRDDI